MRLEIKFCGFRRPLDVEFAASLGIAKAGFIFAPKSPRNLEVSLDTKKWILEVKKKIENVDFVAVIARLDFAQVKIIADWELMEIFQFVGDFSYLKNRLALFAKYPVAGNKRIWVSLSKKDLDKFYHNAELWKDLNVSGVVLDSLNLNYYGGTGSSVEYDSYAVEKLLKLQELDFIKDIFLAGGLSPLNIQDILKGWESSFEKYFSKDKQKLRQKDFLFNGLDLASGIEIIDKNGKPVKGKKKMAEFMKNARLINF